MKRVLFSVSISTVILSLTQNMLFGQAPGSAIGEKDDRPISWRLDVQEISVGGPVALILESTRTGTRKMRLLIDGEDIGDLSRNASLIQQDGRTLYLLFVRLQNPRQSEESGTTKYCFDAIFDAPGTVSVRLVGEDLEEKEIPVRVLPTSQAGADVAAAMFPCLGVDADREARERMGRYGVLVSRMGLVANDAHVEPFHEVPSEETAFLRHHPDWQEIVDVYVAARRCARTASLYTRELEANGFQEAVTPHLEPLRAQIKELEAITPRGAFAAAIREKALERAKQSEQSSEVISRMKERQRNGTGEGPK